MRRGEAAVQEAGVMVVGDEAGRLAARRPREADRAVLGLELDDQRAEDVDREALPRGAIFGIARHRRRDMVVDPVAARLVVIVGAAAAYGEGADMPDFRQAAGPAEVELLQIGRENV